MSEHRTHLFSFHVTSTFQSICRAKSDDDEFRHLCREHAKTDEYGKVYLRQMDIQENLGRRCKCLVWWNEQRRTTMTSLRQIVRVWYKSTFCRGRHKGYLRAVWGKYEDRQHQGEIMQGYQVGSLTDSTDNPNSVTREYNWTWGNPSKI